VNPSGTEPLTLNGEGLRLVSARVNGQGLSESDFSSTPQELTVQSVQGQGLPAEFTLETIVSVNPSQNLSCEGLYLSNGMFLTQCEAESFRRITYFLDRPDVMSRYSVVVRADAKKYPVLLSNGNLVRSTSLPEGRHEAEWHDPHRKPCYLFALVAGDLGVVTGQFRTRSGRQVRLEVYASHDKTGRCQHALESLAKAMRWDEERFGLEYDLDIYMIVAADHFNMGAMENKGLNIFNASYVLADEKTATDVDYDLILSIVGHEYFHNWTGNRVTCRDWFQLSLKEGLTVFRDQEFSADMSGSSVKRIEEVLRLRTAQFAEDAGPMAHPIRPSSYIAIDNFYTMTVYEKGAEVIRMMQTMLGREGFRRGLDLYFERHDGQAVTTDDFVSAMEGANRTDLSQFRIWYEQAGTPTLTVEVTRHEDDLVLTIAQEHSPSPNQPVKRVLHIPVLLGLLDQQGRELPFTVDGGGANGEAVKTMPWRSHSNAKEQASALIHLRQAKQSFRIRSVPRGARLSFLRGFSAPVKVNFAQTPEDRAFLLRHDMDEVNRWDSGQTLAVETILEIMKGLGRQPEAESLQALGLPQPSLLATALKGLLQRNDLPPDELDMLLAVPNESYVSQFCEPVDPDLVHRARKLLVRDIATHLESDLLRVYQTTVPDTGPKRSLRNGALAYLAQLGREEHLLLAWNQLVSATKMSDEIGALAALNTTSHSLRDKAMAHFREKWQGDSLVINKWLSLQALCPLPGALDRIRAVTRDPVFDANTPNKIYALWFGFARGNLKGFHDLSGESYRFIADQVLDVDSRNPQVAARLVSTFSNWRTLEPRRQKLMIRELRRMAAHPGLSSNVFEIVTRSLDQAEG
jgi:aminopeptidase N